MKNTIQLFDTITGSQVFRIGGPEIDLPQAIIDLCTAISGEDKTDWTLGEGGECTLDEFIIGAHWALTEWHGGQSSDTYAALSATGGLFSPGMTAGPEPGTGEELAYELIDQYFSEQKAGT